MNSGQKPEWIELADSDTAIKHHKIIKGLPILAVVITTAIIGAGAIFAQPQELSVANADPIVATSSQNSDQVAPVVPDVANTESTQVGTADSENSAVDSTIATMPSVSSDNEGDNEGDNGNDEGDNGNDEGDNGNDD